MDRREFAGLSAAGLMAALFSSGDDRGLQLENLPLATRASIDALLEDPPDEAGAVFVLGYFTPGDGGGGLFSWNPDSEQSADGGRVLAPRVNGEADPPPGRWIRVIEGGGQWSTAWWGAVGDAGENASRDNRQRSDAVAIQSALDAAAARGQDYLHQGAEVCVPPGTYAIDRTLTLPEGTALLGAGIRATTLRVEMEEGPVIKFTPDAGHQRVAGLTIRSREERPRVTGILLPGSEGQDGSGHFQARIEDVYTWKVGTGIRGRQVWMSSLKNVRVQFADQGIYLSDGFTTLHLENCFAGSCREGIRIEDVNTVTLTSCASDKATRFGYVLRNGAFVMNTCQSEAAQYAANGAVIRLEGPATAQIHGFTTFGIGAAESVKRGPVLVECHEGGGAVRADVGIQVLKPSRPDGQAASPLVRFVGSAPDGEPSSSVTFGPSHVPALYRRIVVDTPPKAQPSVQALPSAGISVKMED